MPSPKPNGKGLVILIQGTGICYDPTNPNNCHGTFRGELTAYYGSRCMQRITINGKEVPKDVQIVVDAKLKSTNKPPKPK